MNHNNQAVLAAAQQYALALKSAPYADDVNAAYREAEAALLEAIREWSALDQDEARIAELEAKERVCDAYRSYAAATAADECMHKWSSLQEALRALQEKQKP